MAPNVDVAVEAHALAEAEGDRRSELFNILLNGYDESDGRVARLLKRAGYLEQRQAYCIVAVQPINTGEMESPARAQRIANALAQLWSDHGQAQQALEGLLVDRRGGRRGLPDPVQAELLALQAHLKSRPVPPPAPAPMPRETQELLHARRVLEAAGYRVIAPAS